MDNNCGIDDLKGEQEKVEISDFMKKKEKPQEGEE
jgi:hypothetical protein